MKKNSLLLLFLVLSQILTAQLFYKDVASTFYARCTSCHHNGASDFPFMNYSQTSASSSSIQNYLTLGKMPPWNADTAYTRFRHERIITASEKQKILTWISGGSLMGDTTLAPNPPSYSNGYQLAGDADLTLSIGSFTSTATNADKYYCFSIPSGLTQDRIIRAFEIVPGNPAIVHHAVVTADTNGTYLSNLSGNCFNIPGNLSIGNYAPGTKATVFPGQAPLKAGIRLKAGSKVIIQMHHPAGSIGQVDSTKIRLYFYPLGTTGVRSIYSSTPLQNWSMSILANTTATYSAYYPSATVGLPTPLSVFAVMPHSHLICKSMLIYAVNPGVDTIKLVRIKDWNFEWQDYYLFNNLVKIPSGYKLYAKHVYDNTSNNPNNPNNPPINVYAGTSTDDEMLFDGLMYLTYQVGDELIDLKSIIDNDPIFAVGLAEQNKEDLVLKARAYPNPFHESVRLAYALYKPAEITVEIHDVLGRIISQQHLGKKTEGVYTWDWTGLDEGGSKMPSGVYFYKIKAGQKQVDGKIIKQD